MRKCSFDLLSLLFSFSCLSILFLSALPSTLQWFSVLLLGLLVIFFALVLAKIKLAYIAILLFGFLWSTGAAKFYLDRVHVYIDQTLAVEAIVSSINTLPDDKHFELSDYRVTFDLLQVNGKRLLTTIPISITWNQNITPMAGQRWRLNVKTKVVHGNVNEGGFDQQRFAIANRALLTGKLLKAELIADKITIKQRIINRCLPYIQRFPYYDVLLALAFGDRQQLTANNRLIMMNSGIMHLMAISGMHIILVFILCSQIMKYGLFILPIQLTHYSIPIVAGWIAAVLYAWLSGLNPPALRAIVALSIWIYLRYKNGQLSAWQKLNRIIAILLFYDPLLILSDSFWLSCYAVASLIFLSEWMSLPTFMQYKKRWYPIRLLHLQFGLTVLLLPMQWFIFHGFSDLSFFTNLLAIPLVSLVTFPAIVVALIVSHLNLVDVAYWPWWVAEWSLEWLFDSLFWINSSWVDLSHHFMWMSFIGWIGTVMLRSRYFGQLASTSLVILLILIVPFFKRSDYVWRLDMLDIGHGLAMVIHNGQDAILYDTGGKWANNSAAQRVIIPFLKWHDLTVKGIIISHEHSDHIGGLAVIKQYYPNAWLMSSSANLANDYDCTAGNHFQWGPLTFDVLWPDTLVNNAQNKDSCVIKLSDDQFSILLTGDLESKQEQQLILKYKQTLSSTFLQIPHHGSTTSSSYSFLKQVSPKMALASTSRYNPWRLPSYKVINRYKALGLPHHVTAKTGQISLIFNQQGWQLKTMREKMNARWYHDWFGSLPIYE